jgi:hypothetical protein
MIILRLPVENYNIVSWKKKALEVLEYLLVSFRFYFVIVGDNSYIFVIYYSLLNMSWY